MQHPRIKRDPNVMFGKPVIAGTRITVEHILRLLGAGDSVEEIVEGHPHHNCGGCLGLRRPTLPTICRTKAWLRLNSDANLFRG